MLVKLDRERLQGILAAMAEQLRGDWLLVGGALVALWLEPRRVTEDIDLVGLGSSGEERLDLMRFADAMGLPIEAVNSAADYFVRRVPGWEDELERFHAAGQVRIYRPTATPVRAKVAECLRLGVHCAWVFDPAALAPPAGARHVRRLAERHQRDARRRRKPRSVRGEEPTSNRLAISTL